MGEFRLSCFELLLVLLTHFLALHKFYPFPTISITVQSKVGAYAVTVFVLRLQK